MTTLTDPHKASFKPSMLIYDTRYRSMTIQIFVLIALIIFVFWLINNTVTNLVDLGKPVEFRFLSEAASYDINQRLIDYNSRDSHLRASFVGLLNTLVVAFLGCITATFLGVLIGVGRLSKNWLIAKIMAFYVETFRNVPAVSYTHLRAHET